MNQPIKLLYTIGPLEFWLYSADSLSPIVGPAVVDDKDQRIGQLVVRLKGAPAPDVPGRPLGTTVKCERDGDTWTIHDTGLD